MPATTCRALAGARQVPFWLDAPDRPEPLPALVGDVSAHLLVVGGGYQGLWSALKAKERWPEREVVLLEGGRIGVAASGRNGGFVSASLTHGIANGHRRWPEETAEVERLGLENLDALEADLRKYGIECEFERTGKLAVATEPHHLAELEETRALLNRHGHHVEMLDAGGVAQHVVSHTFLGGMFEQDAAALVNPARLAWGLRRAVLDLGVRVHEGSPALALRRVGRRVVVRTPAGSVRAEQVVLATNAFPSLLRRLRLQTVPVYDYVLVTEPLTPAQRTAIGWGSRVGLTDAGNEFHYFRQTADHRILWGGYDAIYHYGSRVGPDLEQRPATFAALAAQFVATFPQLDGIRFTHAWGGAIDTCTRFFASYGTACSGRVAYAVGHTGLGVAATRFAAETMLDLLSGDETARTRLSLVRRGALPFPPEPLRWIGIQLTRWSLSRADRRGGRRNLWLRLLDRFGVGFDS